MKNNLITSVLKNDNVINELKDSFKDYKNEELATLRIKLTDIINSIDVAMMDDNDYYEYIRTKKGSSLTPQDTLNRYSKKLDKIGVKILSIKNPFGKTDEKTFDLIDREGNVKVGVSYNSLYQNIRRNNKNFKFRKDYISYEDYMKTSNISNIEVTERTNKVVEAINDIVSVDEEFVEEKINTGLFRRLISSVFSIWK